MKKRIFGMISAAVMAVASISAAPVSAASVGQKLTVVSGQNMQERGNCDGYSYEVWIDKTGGSGSMTLGSGGTFQTEWSATMSQGNFLARRGRSYDSDRKKATSYDTIVLNYAADYTASNQGNSRLCVYGWYRDPLVEYYIIEDWKNWNPSMDANKQDSRLVTIDGAQYEIFWLWHTGPDITGGSSRFKQYFSVRKNTRTSGSITVTEHFKAWENAGWDIGTLYEIALNVEGWESSGSANVTKVTLTGTPDPDPDPGKDPEPEFKYTAPSGSGTGITDGFEGSGSTWAGRGTENYGFSSDFVHGGSKSMYVTGRTGAWNGLAVPGSSELTPGQTYQISAFTGFKSTNYNSLGFTLGMQYDDASGKTNYDNLVDADCANGKWCELATEFTVPAGASNISLYVQTAYTESPTEADLLSFFLDDVRLTGNEIATTTTEEITTTTTEETTTKPAVITGKKGDVDCNDAVNVADAVLLAQYCAEISGTTVSAQGLLNADVDGVQGLNSDDTAFLLMAIAGLESLG